MVCSTPLGLPVEPEVYRMKSGSSLSMGCGHRIHSFVMGRALRGTSQGQCGRAAAMSWCIHTSLPACMRAVDAGCGVSEDGEGSRPALWVAP